ncbi:MAG TPA: TIGR03118 family protein [Flavisolibacter sp.]|nr:TIGR03118 family protein [Flavisolibacter sp.]
MNPKPFSILRITAVLFLFVFMLSLNSCQKDHPPTKSLKDFNVRMLAGNNNKYGAEHVISTLQNAWGLAFSSSGTPWVNAQAGHVSDVMDSIGNRIPAVDPVNIPSSKNTTGGSPTGIVFNPNSDQFVIPSGNGSASQAARFIFVGDDGVVSAWNGTWGHNSYRVAANEGSYTGLTLASNNGANYLYAANLETGKIEVWDWTWNSVKWPGAFADPNLPNDYSPFNIQVVGDKLYVTYAKASNGDEVKGAGLGLVDIYTTNGAFVKRFATGGTLNAPWGVAMAPLSFLNDDENNGKGQGPVILIGNFGDGRINAYRASDGKFMGQLSMHNMPITIDGLWALSFAPSTSPINPNLLYFTAGPDDEQNGLFGYISRADKGNGNGNGNY